VGDQPPRWARLAERSRLREQAEAAFRESKFEETLSLLEKLLARERELFPDTPLDVEQTVETLAAHCLYAGRDADARDLADGHAKFCGKAYGAKSWQAAYAVFLSETVTRLATVPVTSRAELRALHVSKLRLLQESDPAGVANKSVEIAKRAQTLLGERDPALIQFRIAAAEALVAAGRAAEASQHALQAINAAERALGKRHAVSVGTRVRVGRLLCRTGPLPEAKAQLQEALDACNQLAFPELAAVTQFGLAECHFALKDERAAVAALEQAAASFGKLSVARQAAEGLMLCGDAFRNLRRLPDAVKHFSAAAQIYDPLGDLDQAGIAALAVGTCHGERNDAQAALASLAVAKRHFRETRNALGMALVDSRLGTSHFALKQYAEAAEHWHDAAKGFQALPQRDHFVRGERIEVPGLLAVCYRLAALCHVELKDHEAAVRDLLEAKDRLNKVKGLELVAAHTTAELARSLHGLKRFHEAIPHFSAAATAYAQLKRPVDAAWMHHWQGTCYRELWNWPRSIEQFQSALALFEASGKDREGVLRSLEDQADVCWTSGDYVMASQVLRRLLDLVRDKKDVPPSRRAKAAVYLGATYLMLGDIDRGRELCAEAARTLQETSSKEDAEAMMRIITDVVDSRVSKSSKNVRDFLEPLLNARLASKSRDGTTAGLMQSLAMIEFKDGNHEKAFKLCSEAAEIYEKTHGAEHPVTLLCQCAAVKYGSRSQTFEQGLKSQRAALSALEKLFGNHLHVASEAEDVGDFCLHAGRPQEAAPHYKTAVTVVRRNLDLFAAAQAESQQLSAIKDYRRHLNNLFSVADLAKLDATELYEHVLAWKGSVLRTQLVQRALWAKPEQAQTLAAFRAKSSELSTRLLSATRQTDEKPGTRTSWQEDVAKLTREVEDLQRSLAESSPEFRRAVDAARLTPTQLRESLPPEVSLVDLVQYTRYTPKPDGAKGWNAQSRFAAFVVRRDNPLQMVELGPVAPIEKTITQWRREVLAKGNPTGAVAGTLRELLWLKLQAHLKGKHDPVLISPDGALNSFPWGALPGDIDGTYLIEERPIAVVPVPQLVPQLLASPMPAGAAPESLLMVGDIDYGNAPGKAGDLLAARTAAADERGGKPWGFRALEHASGEVAMIERAFRGRFTKGQVTELGRLGKPATESEFRRQASQHRWLHLVTHGYFNDEKLVAALSPDKDQTKGATPLGSQGPIGLHPGVLSGLALEGANIGPQQAGDDDGILTAIEVAALDLRGIEMAVLSACQTGEGKLAAGEGVLGLQRAFQVAGARSTVTSLWRVDDKATRDLMEQFYLNLWGQKKLTKLDALRAAQVWILNDRPADRGLPPPWKESPRSTRVSPYYWAGFILSGDWR
jgi:CHAT domain-containing protein